MRGKSKISAKLRRRQKNVVDEQSQKMKEKLDQERQVKVAGGQKAHMESNKKSNFDPLARFAKKAT